MSGIPSAMAPTTFPIDVEKILSREPEQHPERFKPLPLRVIGTPGGNPAWLEPEDEPAFSGLIILPRARAETYGDDGKRPPIIARVVAMGPGRIIDDGKRIPPPCKVGDRVLVGAYEGHKVEWMGRKFLVAYDVAIHAIVLED